MARILIIEDDNEYRHMVCEMLKKAGYTQIEEAEDGILGLKLFRQNPFDLVITDIIMPKGEGIQFIHELVQEFPQVKLIAMSGGGKYGNEEYLEFAKAFGACRALAKPFHFSDLIDLLRELGV